MLCGGQRDASLSASGTLQGVTLRMPFPESSPCASEMVAKVFLSLARVRGYNIWLGKGCKGGKGR